MVEELREEMEKLRDEIQAMKEQLEREAESKQKLGQGIYIDVGERLRDYAGDVMEGVAEGIHGELESSIFIGPHGRHVRVKSPASKIHKHLEHTRQHEPDYERIASAMSALGQEYRLMILNELMSGGKYLNELQATLPNIATSTLSSHLNVLEETGLIIHER